MSDEILVTQAGMSALADRLRDAVQTIGALLRELDEKVAGLRGGFTGAASDAYKRAHDAWTAELGEMNAALDRYRSNTVVGAELFRDAVRKNEQTWS